MSPSMQVAYLDTSCLLAVVFDEPHAPFFWPPILTSSLF